MSFTVYLPAFPLAEYIDCFWHTRLRVPYRSEFILPSSRVELIINFGDRFRLYEDVHRAQPGDPHRVMHHSWLVGLQTGPLHNEPVGMTHMVGIRFKPGGTWPFFGPAVAATANDVVSLDAILGREAELLREQLYAAATPKARFSLLEKLLCRRLNRPHEHHVRISHAVQRLQQTHGDLAIRQLSDEVGFSHKHLVSLFKTTIGLTPKTLGRLCRLEHVLHTLNPSAPDPWAAIAHDAGFHDQAHFNRDFSAFTGLSPSVYLARRRAAFGPNLDAGDGVHFVPTG